MSQLSADGENVLSRGRVGPGQIWLVEGPSLAVRSWARVPSVSHYQPANGRWEHHRLQGPHRGGVYMENTHSGPLLVLLMDQSNLVWRPHLR